GSTRARSIPWSAQARGSANAARAVGSARPSGTTFLATRRGGSAMNSPYAPLTNRRSSQRFGRPARHERQAPHGAEFAATTRSPSRKPGTPAPTAATVPANSWPNTVGTFGIMTGWRRRRVRGGEGELAVVERLEPERERVAAAREVVDRPAVAEASHRPRQHVRTAARDDDLVRAAPLRELALRGRRHLGRACGGRAQAPGDRRPLGDRVASDDGSARVPEELDEEAADRAEADDDHRVAGLDARALHRPETARERLDERRGLVGHVAGQPEHGVTDVRRGHTHALREAPGIEVRRLERGTHRG